MSDGMFMYGVSEGTRLLVQNVWEGHYKKLNDETPADSLQRVVDFIYQNEIGSYEHKLATDMLMNGYFNPGGRIHAGAGTGNLVTLLNCFVMDDIADSLDSIMDVLRQSALTSQQGGGIGMNFGTLRPKNAVVRRTNSVSSGVLPFMDMWHYMCATIKSAGTRRGAMMGILPVWHPDIIDFIQAKQTQGRLTNFNVSVAVTDAFMEAVEGDLPWDLFFNVPHATMPQEEITIGDEVFYIYKTLPARELWDMILRNTYEYSEPGVIFIDRVNDLNNLAYCERISATNPCVTSNTNLFTVTGIQKAMDIIPGYGVWNTGLRGGVADEIEVYEHQPIYKVSFSDGGELECTAGHIFYTMHHHQSLEYSTMRTDELQHGTLVRVSEGPKYYNTKTELPGVEMHGLNNFDFGYHYGAALVKDHWIKRYLPKLDTTICNMILELTPDSKPEYLTQISETILHKAHFTIHRGLMMGIVDTLGVMEKVDTPDFQIAVPIPNDTLRKQLRLIFLCNGIHPLYRESDNAFLLKGDNLKPLQAHVQPDTFYRAIQSHLATYVPQPINWTARVVSVEDMKKTDIVFDVYEKVTDSWVTEGYASKGCGEQPLPPFGQCDLGSINLARLVSKPFADDSMVDVDSLYKAIEAGVRFLDNVLDVSNYPLEEQKQEAHSKRRIGLGITGLANMLEFLKIRYGSQECIKYVGEMMHLIMDYTYRCSALLAREKGSFPLFDLAEFKKSPMWDKLSSETQWCIEKYGIRNGVLLTVAPTGSTSIYYGNVSSGLEPVFSHRYMRKVLQHDDTWKELVVHDYAFDKYCEQFGEPADLADLPEYMVTANELSVDEHLAVQAVIQQYIDSSVSKTINCPSDMDYEQFKGVYEKAYALGLKGCTTYRPSLVRGWIMKEVDKMSTEDCCEHPNLVIEEGCSKCLNCGTSKCSF